MLVPGPVDGDLVPWNNGPSRPTGPRMTNSIALSTGKRDDPILPERARHRYRDPKRSVLLRWDAIEEIRFVCA